MKRRNEKKFMWMIILIFHSTASWHNQPVYYALKSNLFLRFHFSFFFAIYLKFPIFCKIDDKHLRHITSTFLMRFSLEFEHFTKDHNRYTTTTDQNQLKKYKLLFVDPIEDKIEEFLKRFEKNPNHHDKWNQITTQNLEKSHNTTVNCTL